MSKFRKTREKQDIRSQTDLFHVLVEQHALDPVVEIPHVEDPALLAALLALLLQVVVVRSNLVADSAPSCASSTAGSSSAGSGSGWRGLRVSAAAAVAASFHLRGRVSINQINQLFFFFLIFFSVLFSCFSNRLSRKSADDDREALILRNTDWEGLFAKKLLAK